MWQTLNQTNNEAFDSACAWTKIIGNKESFFSNGSPQPELCVPYLEKW
jgi:hypothetical protein